MTPVLFDISAIFPDPSSRSVNSSIAVSHKFDIWAIWPDLSAAVNFSSDWSLIGFSSLAVLLIIIFFSYNMVRHRGHYLIGVRRLNFFLECLSGITKENFPQLRPEIKRRIMGVSEDDSTSPQKSILFNRLTLPHIERERLSKIWQEFNESLVVSDGGSRIHNTLDAHHFFHADNMAHEYLNNRFAALVPGLLTGLGVLGTFIGLTQGLSGITLSQDANVSELRQGIAAMINGANAAFMTSLWGVLLSLLFGSFDKICEERLRSKLRALQSHLDFMIPRQTAEQSLVEIAKSSSESKDTMACLAEQIGDSMQKSVKQATTEISSVVQSTLRDLVAPLFKDVSTKAQESSQHAMQQLVDNFMNKISERAEEQKDALNAAATNVSQSVQTISEKMEALAVQQFDAMQQSTTRQESIQKLVSESASQQLRMQDQFMNQLQDRSQILVQHLGEQAQVLQSEQKHFFDTVMQSIGETLSAQNQSQADLIQQSRALINSQETVFNSMSEQLSKMAKSYSDILSSLTAITDNFHAATDSLDAGANKLHEFKSELSSGLQALIAGYKQALLDMDKIQKEMSKQLTALDKVMVFSDDLAVKLESTERGINESTKVNLVMTKNMRDVMNSLQAELKTTVSSFANQLESAMNGYGDMVKEQMEDRMREWNDQTRHFCQNMVAAINSMRDLVDDLETRSK